MSHKLAHLLGTAALSGAVAVTGAVVPSAAGAAPAVARPSVSAVAPDPGTPAVTTGADWMVGELQSGLMLNPWDAVNPGLTIDVALALDAVGRDAEAHDVADAFTAQVADYTAPLSDPDDAESAREVSAGSTAKTAVLAQAVGEDPTGYADTDLIAQLEARVATEGPLAGRIQDQNLDSDSANVFGQIFAVAALTEAESSLAGSATDFLLQQQCESGFFRLSFSARDGDQSCQAGENASPDTTALAVIELQPLAADNPEIATALGRAVAWLAANQKADGSMGGDPWTSASNANSTGLAGWAFGVAGEDEPAAEAAAWLHDLQVTDQTGCEEFGPAEIGAIAYNRAAFDSACDAGIAIKKTKRQQWDIATAQALPALQFLAPTPDPEPVVNSAAVDPTADWLNGQLTDGVVHNDQYGFDDIGLSLDVAFGLAAVGRDTAAQAVVTAVAPQIDGYTGFAPSIYASATAKAASFAQTMGEDPTTFGGVDLIARLEGRVAEDAPIAGRLQDKEDPAFPGDYANVIGQAYAVSALTEAGSSEAASVTDFLLDQQCDAGYFRLSFNADKTAADQSCQSGVDTGDSAADTDATALTVMQLQPLAAGNPDVQQAVAKAVLWLKQTQQDDGSFGGGASTEAPNVNSTGLAGAAFGQVGEAEAAAAAATWVRAHQVDEIAGCALPLARDNGAVAYDAAALKSARTKGITVTTSDQWRRASAQALPALAHAPEDSTSAAPTLAVCGPTRYVRAPSKQTLKVAGLRVGESARVTGPGVSKTVVGTGQLLKVSVKLPKKTGKRTYTVRHDTASARTTFRALGAKKLKLSPKKRVTKRGKHAKVVVRGLAAGEAIKVRYKGKVVRKGHATKSGVYRTKFRVGSRKGTFKVVVRGQFADRLGVVRQRVK